jgi:hypothetical protein
LLALFLASADTTHRGATRQHRISEQALYGTYAAFTYSYNAETTTCPRSSFMTDIISRFLSAACPSILLSSIRALFALPRSLSTCMSYASAGAARELHLPPPVVLLWVVPRLCMILEWRDLSSPSYRTVRGEWIETQVRMSIKTCGSHQETCVRAWWPRHTSWTYMHVIQQIPDGFRIPYMRSVRVPRSPVISAIIASIEQ